MVRGSRALGFDGFVGYEIDRHSAKGQRKSREIIALLNPGFITGQNGWRESEDQS
jgi:hypothetical protein